ncbi:interleukin-9 receptor [Acanthochromis polyacanthus]|uniref:interleukin-9 receptor n=1 Tax=Acanthochromis polyacanthus TaxID=80966 RepID=UPI00223440C1|nr:interleukin-9 receptor [Acanthochromis polyacanthus]
MSGLRMKLTLLIVFLLRSSWLHGNPTTGVDHDLHCVTDYLVTVNCTLNIAPSGNISNSSSSYWLNFTETFTKDNYLCMLTNTTEGYFCSFKTSDSFPDEDYDYSATFADLDSYEICLCLGGSDACVLLDEEFSPTMNIKPNTPCCLTVNQNSSQHHFTWMSTYEKYSLSKDLRYQLHFYKRGDKHKDTLRDINTDTERYSVDDEWFVPDTEYGARVRSSPNMAHYQGQWSDWSAEVHWKTEPVEDGFAPNIITSEVGKKVFIPLGVMALLVILLCYAPAKKWKQSAFIPNPAPYFDTLYNDCQGDFKSWVVTQESTAAMSKAEETLHIDTLTKCADAQEEEKEERPPQLHLQVMEDSAYSNMTIPVCDEALLGVPYAVSTMAPPSDQKDDLESLTLSSGPQSPGADSGCWLSSNTSLENLEKDPPWYCNEYCTLSAFQQSGSVTAGYCGSL